MALTKKIIGAVAAIALVLTTILTFAFKADIPKQTKSSNLSAATTWYFTGTSAEIHNPTKWRNTGTAPSDCGSGANSPCSIVVDASNIENLESDVLDALSTSEIMDLSPQKRP